MQLSYRGIKYNQNTINSVTEERRFTAKYRGINYQTSSGKSIIKHPNHSLKYRGINYESNPTDNFPNVISNNSPVSSPICSSQLMA